MNLSRLNFLLLVILGILFFTLYTILAWFNRLPYEDYHFISLTKDSSPFQAMLCLYEAYSARWSAHLLGFSFSQYYEHPYFLPTFNLITLAALMLSFYLLLTRILPGDRIKKQVLILYTILFTTSFFFASFDIGEVWYWQLVNWMYLWSLIAGNLLVYVLLGPKRPSPFRFAIIAVLGAYIAGASESYASTYILFLIFLIFLKNKRLLPALTERIHNSVLWFALLLQISLYPIMLFAPGTWVRKGLLTDASFGEHMIMTLKGFGIVVLQIFPLLPNLLLFSVPWLLVGYCFTAKEKIKKGSVVPLVFINGAFLGATIYLLIFPASWILYDPPPARALSQVSLLLAGWFAFAFYWLGSRALISEKLIRPVCSVSLLIAAAFLLFHIYDQFTITKRFSAAYDARIARIIHETNAGRKNTLLFTPLPPSGMLYSDELSADSVKNEFFEKLYSPAFHVAAKNQKSQQ